MMDLRSILGRESLGEIGLEDYDLEPPSLTHTDSNAYSDPATNEPTQETEGPITDLLFEDQDLLCERI
jgi:hypothetical protein